LVYSTEKLDSIKNSARYPIEEVKECFGTDYFSDSCCYMIALAIYQGFKHLKLYGFTYGWGSNYVEEKPGVSFWLGVALGKGLKVSIFGEHSALLKTSDNLMYAYLCDQESSRENIRIVDFQVPTDEVEFGITDRVQLIGFLPKEGDYETVKFSKYLRSHLLFDVEESKQLNFKQVADKTHKDKPFIIWDKNEIPPKKIDLTMAEKSMIASWLFDANDRGKITYDNIDKFCLGDST
jgi:hypothetical protein